jgi:hypothetical protein
VGCDQLARLKTDAKTNESVPLRLRLATRIIAWLRFAPEHESLAKELAEKAAALAGDLILATRYRSDTQIRRWDPAQLTGLVPRRGCLRDERFPLDVAKARGATTLQAIQGEAEREVDTFLREYRPDRRPAELKHLQSKAFSGLPAGG